MVTGGAILAVLLSGVVGRAMADGQPTTGWRGELSRDMNRIAPAAPNRSTRSLVGEELQKLPNLTPDGRSSYEQLAPPPFPPPVLPKYDRLADIPVTLEMSKADVRHVLQVLAKQTNLNLLVHPDVLDNSRPISVRFNEVPASIVFKEILRLADLYGRVEGNILRVDPDQEIVFALDFLETNTTSGFSVGGDVLGTGSETKGALSGRFNIEGTGAKTSNQYEQLESILTGLVQDQGVYQINRQTGTLYLRAKPSMVRTVSNLVNRYKDILSRQVLIDVRIVEVALNDDFRAGIDWSVLRSSLASTYGMTQKISTPQGSYPVGGAGSTAPSLVLSDVASAAIGGVGGLGIGIGGKRGLMFVDLLKQFGAVHVVSNPTIRARHGQPAMISVGKSEAYVKQVTTTTDETTGNKDFSVETAVTFDGLMIGVIAFITTDDKVTLTIHPIQSSVVDGSLDAKTFGTSSVSLPKVNLKEISTILEIRNRDTVLLGGLIDKSRAKLRTGVPVLSALPLVGGLFTRNTDTESNKELVLMLRVSIL